ncbi:alpha-N-acetylgalactosaminidase-like isoform X2 [Oppia nitens]|uniref:alpha-N-acetylgalactosaminidase-like isoform X2 n=1 Tax=Oppia nitens TaxID=1686743 RepID=UPI0023DADC52|nr:alpha-N-acetylgalactosaminidase-like isoform X2 [Oppia nitens]
MTIIWLIDLKLVKTLDNGLVRTPPMGWMSWERFACNIDCDNYPNECISEQLYKDIADRLVADGYKEVGYNYVNIDDCWTEMTRDPVTKRLVANHKRFPNGIKALADYVHSKGLLLGIYGDVGTKTCGGYPGARGEDGTDYDTIDAQTYAEWGVDSLKLDGCYADTKNMTNMYPEMSRALNSSGRAIVYACSWPAYQIGQNPDYRRIAQYCNYWRNFDDIMDSWTSVTSIIDFYAKYQDVLVKYHGPGAWNDPDMLIIGNFGLSLEQSRAQMALWAIWSAPLLMSNDLRSIGGQYKEILQNRDIIAVNQDKLGILGTRVHSKSGIEVWVKPMTPIVKGVNTYAIVYLNRVVLGTPLIISFKLSSLIAGLPSEPLYNVYDLYDNSKLIGKLSNDQNLTLKVNTSGSVRMVKLTPVFKSDEIENDLN